MSSTILYKFRSGTTFEALPLPGSAARLFDVKKAIVVAKRLDQGSMDFDLSVRDATTNEEYTDDAMLLPRGTRLIVKRLPVPPSAKGQGLLAKIARSQYYGITSTTTSGNANQHHQAAFSVAGGPGGNSNSTDHNTGAPHDFYTIDSRARDDDEEFVSSSTAVVDEERELAALRAATETAVSSTVATMSGGGLGRGTGRPNSGFRPGMSLPAGSGGPQLSRPGMPQSAHNARYRPNADPELRDQEKQLMPKKRATGIPRTFLSLKAPPNTGQADGSGGDGGDGTESGVPLLQPNTIGFEELVQRGGGQSESTAGSKRDITYALKLTAIAVPEYLQCAICHKIVKNAMILPWDPEGRTTCESCIRDALNQSGFRCPLTGQDGVSPDDLIPNHALRKAADQFVKEVMAKMEEIEKSHVADEYVDTDGVGESRKSGGGVDLLDGDNNDKGVILSRKAEKKRKQDDDDPFGVGDDPFGGDVFAVDVERNDDEDQESPAIEDSAENIHETSVKVESDTSAHDNAQQISYAVSDNVRNIDPSTEVPMNNSHDVMKDDQAQQPESPQNNDTHEQNSGVNKRVASPYHDNNRSHGFTNLSGNTSSRREVTRRRGPPVGYAMGPAGGAVGSPLDALESKLDGVDEAVPAVSTEQHSDRDSNDHAADFTQSGGVAGRGGGRYADSGRGGRYYPGGRGGRGRNGVRGGRPYEGGRGGRFEDGRGGGRYYENGGRGGRSFDGGRRPYDPARGGRSNDGTGRGGRSGDSGRGGRYGDDITRSTERLDGGVDSVSREQQGVDTKTGGRDPQYDQFSQENSTVRPVKRVRSNSDARSEDTSSNVDRYGRDQRGAGVSANSTSRGYYRGSGGRSSRGRGQWGGSSRGDYYGGGRGDGDDRGRGRYMPRGSGGHQGRHERY